MNKYPADRITDNRAQFSLRFLDHYRQSSPRQRRLRQLQNAKVAAHYEMIRFVCQVLVAFGFLALITLLFFAL